MEIFYVCHLDDEQHIGTIPLPSQLGQALQMLDTPVRGSIGEGADTVIFQSDTFDFQKALSAVFQECKVKPGIAMKGLCLQILDFAESAAAKPFPGSNIWGLRVHIDEPVTLADGDQVEFCFPAGIAAFLTPDLGPVRQKLPTPAGVFDMDGFRLSGDFHMGNKPVWPGKEKTGDHILILQEITTFLLKE